MKKTFRTILSILLIAACSLSFYSCSKIVWETDFSVVQKQSQEQNKGMLIFFSGNEWDKVSPELMAGFLSDRKFKKEVDKEFVLYTVDVPEDISSMTDEGYTNLMILTGACKVNTCPAIIACDKDGAPFYEIPYQAGITTLDDLIQEVRYAVSTKITLEKLEAKLSDVMGAERVAVIDELVSAVPEAYRSRYYELLCTIPLIDPENESGLVGKYTLVAAEQRASSRLLQGDCLGSLEEFASCAGNDYLTIPQKQECLYYAAYFATEMNLWEEAISYMEQALVLNPGSETGQMIAEMLPQMKANLQITQTEVEEEE